MPFVGGRLKHAMGDDANEGGFWFESQLSKAVSSFMFLAFTTRVQVVCCSGIVIIIINRCCIL